MQMLGFLHNNNDVMIVYEYMPNGNLWDVLHGREERKNIAADSPASPPPSTAGLLVDWVSRYNVATGVAHGLAYLHHDCRPPVIHRDIKSNNILLDSNLEARIADFGLAKTLLRKNETISIIVGSYGYIAPGEFSLISITNSISPLLTNFQQNTATRQKWIRRVTSTASE